MLQGAHRDPGATTSAAMGWLKHLFLTRAQEDPRSHKRWLPTTAYATRQAVYQDYVEDMAKGQQKSVSYAYFLVLWKEHWPNVGFPRHNPFARCDICDELRKAMDLCTFQTEDGSGHSALKVHLDRHLKMVSADRQHYHEQRQVSMRNFQMKSKILACHIFSAMVAAAVHLMLLAILLRFAGALFHCRTCLEWSWQQATFKYADLALRLPQLWDTFNAFLVPIRKLKASSSSACICILDHRSSQLLIVATSTIAPLISQPSTCLL